LFLQKGLNDFIAKPIDVKHLNTVLERWIPENKKIVTLPENSSEFEETINLRIPGIDIASGLRNVSGSLDVYRDILEEFCLNVEDIAVQIRQAGQEHNSGLLADSLHALKGVSRSIGALELGDLAESMEKAVKFGNAGTLNEKTAELLKDIRTLTNAIRAAPAARQAEPEFREGADVSIPHLELLKNAITSLDIDSVNQILMEYLSIPKNSDTKAKVDAIEEHILMFEYGKAVEIIDQMLCGGLPGSPP
jgi:HPt (histidine-containing phosphotransfer) domain-containing protein